MSSTELSGAQWRKSSYSNGQANCVEVAAVGGGPSVVAVRDTKAPDGPSLVFTAKAWQHFTVGVAGVQKVGLDSAGTSVIRLPNGDNSQSQVGRHTW